MLFSDFDYQCKPVEIFVKYSDLRTGYKYRQENESMMRTYARDKRYCHGWDKNHIWLNPVAISGMYLKSNF